MNKKIINDNSQEVADHSTADLMGEETAVTYDDYNKSLTVFQAGVGSLESGSLYLKNILSPSFSEKVVATMSVKLAGKIRKNRLLTIDLTSSHRALLDEVSEITNNLDYIVQNLQEKSQKSSANSIEYSQVIESIINDLEECEHAILELRGREKAIRSEHEMSRSSNAERNETTTPSSDNDGMETGANTSDNITKDSNPEKEHDEFEGECTEAPPSGSGNDFTSTHLNANDSNGVAGGVQNRRLSQAARMTSFNENRQKLRTLVLQYNKLKAKYVRYNNGLKTAMTHAEYSSMMLNRLEPIREIIEGNRDVLLQRLDMLNRSISAGSILQPLAGLVTDMDKISNQFAEANSIMADTFTQVDIDYDVIDYDFNFMTLSE